MLNNLDGDIGEKKNLAGINAKQTRELKKLAEAIRPELGDWNVIGSDRAELAYPGNLNELPTERKRH